MLVPDACSNCSVLLPPLVAILSPCTSLVVGALRCPFSFLCPPVPTTMITFNCLYGLDYNKLSACAADCPNRLSLCALSSPLPLCHQRCRESVYVCQCVDVLFAGSSYRANLLLAFSLSVSSVFKQSIHLICRILPLMHTLFSLARHFIEAASERPSILLYLLRFRLIFNYVRVRAWFVSKFTTSLAWPSQ